ncbi:MAG TPA: type I restriction-modification system subunit M N-terminal domain-containing protein [Candidatus Acidoferrum sp.]|jgi:type I restriction enzyme M protein|nr:type I restriction-modification system subunit M N-terminal domain-containing protein [Candidatus Acidoferrum sp.]
MSNPTALVQKLWNYCNILRDGGLSYGGYAQQLTFLLFLKMADEESRPPFNKSPGAVSSFRACHYWTFEQYSGSTTSGL